MASEEAKLCTPSGDKSGGAYVAQSETQLKSPKHIWKRPVYD